MPKGSIQLKGRLLIVKWGAQRCRAHVEYVGGARTALENWGQTFDRKILNTTDGDVMVCSPLKKDHFVASIPARLARNLKMTQDVRTISVRCSMYQFKSGSGSSVVHGWRASIIDVTG